MAEQAHDQFRESNLRYLLACKLFLLSRVRMSLPVLSASCNSSSSVWGCRHGTRQVNTVQAAVFDVVKAIPSNDSVEGRSGTGQVQLSAKIVGTA